MTDRDDKRMVEFPERELEALFAEARRETMLPSGGLMERILADAEAMIDTREATEAARLKTLRGTPAKQRHPLVAAMVAALGGWRAVAGLATAGVAGLAIGLGTPSAVTSLATGAYVSGEENYDTATSGYGIDALLPSFYELAVEG
jgi:hypothetical protein